MEKGFIPIVPLLWLGYGYTALVASRGIFGYVKTGRVPSLVVELFFSSLAGLGSYQLSQDPKNVWLFLAATSGTLAGVMALRSYYYGKVMPVGLIAGASFKMKKIFMKSVAHLPLRLCSWAILPSPLHSFLGEGPSTQLFHLQRQVQPSQF
uniref:transmembrane protein 14B-like isoform X1 n=1 Tax=Callithrix jacchus TaxID=9483 RepID=UPI00159DB69F|nr:transmembrane protein 14B-like isoform X1 [Callithrix jacchus]XP_054109733.1 transmembrane protein 14B-like isoform X1 [Callithrix jacchus]